MKIEIKLYEKTFGRRNASVVWEPVINPFTNWWLEHYIGREMYKEQQYDYTTHTKKAYNTDAPELQNPDVLLKNQSEYLREVINEVNSYLEQKDAFPIRPQDINLKLDAKSRQMLNDIHRYFVRVSYPKGMFIDHMWTGYRTVLPDKWRFNWHMDQPDILDYYHMYPGDFDLEANSAKEFMETIKKLNDGCHDIEPLYYSRSGQARNMEDCTAWVVGSECSDAWKYKYAIEPKTKSIVPETIEHQLATARRMAPFRDIPFELYEHQTSDNSIDVWCPQDCILGKNPAIAYCDEDDPKHFDIHNGHQVNFHIEFTTRADRKFLKRIGWSGKIPYGWPLGRVLSGHKHIEKLNRGDKEYNHKDSTGHIEKIIIHED